MISRSIPEIQNPRSAFFCIYVAGRKIPIYIYVIERSANPSYIPGFQDPRSAFMQLERGNTHTDDSGQDKAPEESLEVI